MQRKAEGHEKHGWHIRWLDAIAYAHAVGLRRNAPPAPLEMLPLRSKGAQRLGFRDAPLGGTAQSTIPMIPPFYVRVGSTTRISLTPISPA